MHPCEGTRSGLHTSALHTVLHTVHEAEHRAGCNAHSPGCRAHSPGCRAHTTSCKGQSALHRAQLGLVHRSRQALPFSHPAGAACTVVHQTNPHHRILPLRPAMPHLASSWTPIPLESLLIIYNLCLIRQQGCINRSIIPSGIGARSVSLEHVENMELRCALVLGEPCSGSRRTVLWFSENCALVIREPCSGSRRTVL